MIIKKYNFSKDSIDPNKPTIIIQDNGNIEKYTHVYGTGRLIGEYLKDQYNVIYFSTSGKSNVKNLIVFNFAKINKTFHKRTENKNAIEDNEKILYDNLKLTFKDLGITQVDYFIGSADIHYQLPLTHYSKSRNEKFPFLHERQNIFFDYTKSNREVIDTINNINNEMLPEFFRYVNPTAFSLVKKYIGFSLPLFLNKIGMLKHKCIFFSIDPTLYTPFFLHYKIPSDFYYFADDTRGTRMFKKFDIAQFQHLVYDKKYLPQDPIDLFAEPEKPNSKNLLFYGTIFQEKGPRAKVYYQFLNEYRDSDNLSKLYIPYAKNTKEKNINMTVDEVDELLKSVFDDLYDSVSQHPHVAHKTDVLRPNQVPELLKAYKYTLILRCVSPEDSLNFRPVLSVAYNTLPFFDPMYDPENLQVPKELYDRLVVNDAKEIMEKVEHFNRNESERIELIDKLKSHFLVNEYLNEPDLYVKQQIQKIIPEYKIDIHS